MQENTHPNLWAILKSTHSMQSLHSSKTLHHPGSMNSFQKISKIHPPRFLQSPVTFYNALPHNLKTHSDTKKAGGLVNLRFLSILHFHGKEPYRNGRSLLRQNQ
ncbi:MAG: hypothetical protein D6805_01020 [Planctomycetota bacterium]|nr:MAG: hypothetical protein D6805_01020 [Planctomycetota bacterium]